jgi:hypothetical protein
MKMPGFTAEASLYTAEERYHMVQIISQAEGAIQPAQFRRRRCNTEKCKAECNPNSAYYAYCVDTCECLCEGIPCPAPNCNCWLI